MANLSVRSTLSKCLNQSAPISLVEDVFSIDGIPSPNSLKSALQFIQDFRCPPAAPYGFGITAVGEDSIEFGWIDDADNEDGFEVRWSGTRSFLWWTQRDRGSKKFHTPNLTSGSLTNVRPGFRYCIKVRAFNAGGNSDYSNEECVEVPYPTHEQPDPIPTQGVSEIFIENCHVDERTVYIWRRDRTAGTPWEELDSLPSQWHDGSCPAIGSPLAVSLPEEGHWYEVAAVDLNNGNCNGTNYPSGDCIKMQTEPILGDPNGPPHPIPIHIS